VNTIQDYITSARIQMQDTTADPRYPDEQYKLALDLAFDEAYRLRPDLFIRNEVVSVVSSPLSTPVPVPRGYQSAFLYYMCGHVQLQDNEDTTDSRASVFLNKFVAQLMTTPA